MSPYDVPDYLAMARRALEAHRQRGDSGETLSSLRSLLSHSLTPKKNLSSREENATKAIKATEGVQKKKNVEEFKGHTSDTADATEVRPACDESPAALRHAIRGWFILAVLEADGQRVTPTEANALYQEIVRLYDDTGPAFADAVILDEHRRFRWETARCGWCGKLGHALRCAR